jgi:hypothetical protein
VWESVDAPDTVHRHFALKPCFLNTFVSAPHFERLRTGAQDIMVDQVAKGITMVKPGFLENEDVIARLGCRANLELP